MARYIRTATPLNPFFLPKRFQHSAPLSSAYRFSKARLASPPQLRFTPSACRFSMLRLASPVQLRFTSTAKSRCEDDAEVLPVDTPDYNWVDGAEYIGGYRLRRGYHPVMVGDVLHDRYLIVDKLGWGGYSTVWLAHDRHHKEYVAVKVGIANSNSLSQETKSLRALSAPSLHPGHDAIPFPMDEFEVRGPNGTHSCFTMLPARCDLNKASFSHLFTLDVARALVGELTMAISHVHSCGYVHGDIHLGNILVKLPSNFNHLSVKQFYEEYGEPETVPITRRDGKPLPPNVPAEAVIPLDLSLGMKAENFKLHDAHILLSDFGESFSSSEFRRGKDCHSPRGSRPPEAKFEPQAPLSYSADIWSLAVAIWDILGMVTVFSHEIVPEDEVVSYHIDVLGPMPRRWWDRWEAEARGEFFEQDGRPKQWRELWPTLEQAFDGERVQGYRQEQMGVFGEEERDAILHLMRRMLTFEPEERPTIEEVLKSEWMVKWVLPDWKRSKNSETGQRHTPEYLPNGDDIGESVGNREILGK